MNGDQAVNPDLIKIALERALGYQFEAFVNSFYPSLLGDSFVPLGGNKDGGADGFEEPIHESSSRAESFYQASIEADHRAKIRRTVKRLREFKRDPRVLTYVTSRVIRHIDIEEEQLAAELDVTIRIRDGHYIASHINDEVGTRAAYWYHLHHLTDFLKAVGGSTLVTPSDKASSIAVYVFLEQELARRGGDSSLIDAVTDSLILWALEGTDPDANLFMSSADVLERISREIPATRKIVESRADSRLRMLSSKTYPGGRQVRWHQKEDVFVLPYETRQRIQEENVADEALRIDVNTSLRTRAQDAGVIDGDADTVAEVALRSLQRAFEQAGLEFASFLEDEERGDLAVMTDCIRDVLAERSITGKRGLEIGDAAFNVIRGTLYHSVDVERAYLSKLSRTYTLLFTLNTEPRLIEYFQSLTGHLNLYVGTDLLIRALSERHLNPEDQATRRTLRLASRLGARLVLANPVLEEVVGNLRSADWEFRNWFEQIESHVTELMARSSDKILVRSYFYARLDPATGKKSPTSWPTFIGALCRYDQLHSDAAYDNIRRYLQVEFALEYDSTEDLEQIVDSEQLEALAGQLSESKANDRLARNDALMALAIYARRHERREDSGASQFGYETWWLTGESAILRHTREIVAAHRGARYMMRPDFLLNFLTLAPSSSDARATLGHVFPSLLGIRLSRRMKESTFRAVMATVKEAQGYEEGRRVAAIAQASNKLKGDFVRQYRVQLEPGDHQKSGSRLYVASSSETDTA